MTRGNGPMLSAVERVQLLRCEVVRRLVCGCEVGLYRSRTGQVFTIVDDPDDACRNRGHQADFLIDEPSPVAGPAAGHPDLIRC